MSYIRRFAQDFPAAKRFKLEENFRSDGHILDAANAVIAQDRQRIGKTLFTQKSDGDRIEVVGYRDAEAEAHGIADEIQKRVAEGANFDGFAILYRRNALSRGYEEALMRRRIPYALIGDLAFYHKAEIKDALATLRLSASPGDRQGDEAFRRIINVPARGFGTKAMQEVEAEAAFRQVPLLLAGAVTRLFTCAYWLRAKPCKASNTGRLSSPPHARRSSRGTVTGALLSPQYAGRGCKQCRQPKCSSNAAQKCQATYQVSSDWKQRQQHPSQHQQLPAHSVHGYPDHCPGTRKVASVMSP